MFRKHDTSMLLNACENVFLSFVAPFGLITYSEGKIKIMLLCMSGTELQSAQRSLHLHRITDACGVWTAVLLKKNYVTY